MAGEKITSKRIKETIAEIKERVDLADYEMAHSIEDGLYVAVLKAIAAGAGNAGHLAREALKADDMTFTRWYA